MTEEQQSKLLEAVKSTLENHSKVGEAFNDKEDEDNIISKFGEFFNAFSELSEVYSDITSEEVQKQDVAEFNNLFGVMNKHQNN